MTALVWLARELARGFGVAFALAAFVGAAVTVRAMVG